MAPGSARSPHEGRGGSRPSAHRPGRGRRPARRRQRGRRRGGLRADVVRRRVAAHRPGRRGLHAGAHRRGRGPPARLLRRGAGARARTSAEPADLTPIDVQFSEDGVQRFNVGPSSCGAYGTPRRAGRGAAALRHDAAGRTHRRAGRAPPARAWRWCRCRPSCSRCWSRSCRSTPEAAAIYAPGGRLLPGRGDDPAARAGRPAGAPRRRGAGLPLRGRRGRRVADGCSSAAGCSPREDLAATRWWSASPRSVGYRGREVLTNPPPSSGGILIADALGILERLDRPHDACRGGRGDRLHQPGPRRGLPGGPRQRGLPGAVPGPGRAGLGGHGGALAAGQHHPHLRDGRRGRCATVTCSNGSCSGVVVPGTACT